MDFEAKIMMATIFACGGLIAVFVAAGMLIAR